MQSGISADYAGSRIITGNGLAVQSADNSFTILLQGSVIGECPGSDCVGDLVLLPGTGIAESNVLGAVGIIDPGLFSGIAVVIVSRYQRIAAGSPRPYSIVNQLKA